MHSSSTPMIDAIVAETREKAAFAARLLRKLDPFRADPRVAGVDDICRVLLGPELFREDRLEALETLAALVQAQLVEATCAGRRDAMREALDTLYVALLDTVASARRLDETMIA